MTIQHPPGDEMPEPTPDTDRDPRPIDTPEEPEQRAPGPDQLPIGAPRDEPGRDLP